MIVSCVKNRALQGAIGLVAAVDEDVFLADSVGAAPMRNGYPRLLIEESDRPVFESPRIHRSLDRDIPTLVVTSGTLARWRFERRAGAARGRVEEEWAGRLRGAVASAPRPAWVERLFRGLERATGASLPIAFKGFARRILEYPGYYSSLSAVADRVGLTTGALQGRFFRRALRSPSEHLRWLRLFSLTEGLQDPEVTLGDAAARFGYTSAGNLCRSIRTTAGMAPSDLRDEMAPVRLITRFTQRYLGEEERNGWIGMDDLFCRIAPLSAPAHTRSA